jgi:hypothetical protein
MTKKLKKNQSYLKQSGNVTGLEVEGLRMGPICYLKTSEKSWPSLGKAYRH